MLTNPPRTAGVDGHEEYAVVFTDEASGDERMGFLRDTHLAQASEAQIRSAFKAAE